MSAPSPSDPHLALYMTWTCPHCKRVLEALAKLELQVELVDIAADDTARGELTQQVGRAIVPVLRTQDSTGERWIRESSIIIHHLRAQAGKPSRVPAWMALWLERLSPVAFGCLAAGFFSTSAVVRPALIATSLALLAGRTLARRL